MRSLVARAPTRIDFGGGWTDVPPYSEEQGGCVCNVAISRHAIVRLSADDATGATGADGQGSDSAIVAAALRRADSPPISVRLRSDFPVGAGLGGSSAAGVAIIGALNAWRNRPCAPGELAESSRRLEVEELHVAGGRQDHYAAAFGGALGLWFGSDTTVQRIPLPPLFKGALEQQCLIAYTGQSRISAETITAVLDAYRDRQPRVLEALGRMKQLAADMVVALQSEDVVALGGLVGEHWAYQRSLHPAIPTPRIDAILDRARRAGAHGGKALGASGGGCVLVIAPVDALDRVRTVVAELADLVPFSADERGFHVELVET